MKSTSVIVKGIVLFVLLQELIAIVYYYSVSHQVNHHWGLFHEPRRNDTSIFNTTTPHTISNQVTATSPCQKQHNVFDFTQHNGCVSTTQRPHCQFHDMRIHVTRMHAAAQGGEVLSTVMGQAESAEFLSYDAGAFVVVHDDDLQLPESHPPAFHYMHDVLRAVQSSTVENTTTCAETWNGTTLLITRYEYVNLYHTMTDWWNTFFSMPYDNGNVEKVNHLIFLDAHPQGTLDSVWQQLFAHQVHWARHLPDHLCFEHARFVPPGYTSSLYPRHTPLCSDAAQADAFVQFVLQSYQLQNVQREPGHIVVLDRVSYVAHPRSHIHAVPQRGLTNLRTLAERLPQELAASHIDWRVTVSTMIDLSMPEQLALVRSADILIANHGAGLTHLLFLEDGADVVELSCGLNFFTHLQTWRPDVTHHCIKKQLSSHVSEEFWKRHVIGTINAIWERRQRNAGVNG